MKSITVAALVGLLSITPSGALAAVGEAEAPEALELSALAADASAELGSQGEDAVYTMTCEGRITNVFGGSQSCSRSVGTGSFWSRLNIKITPSWSSLASGTMTFQLSDGFGTYYAGGCVAPRPAVFTSDVHCTGGLVRSTVLWGTHGLQASTTYNFCGWSVLGCGWKVVAELTTS